MLPLFPFVSFPATPSPPAEVPSDHGALPALRYFAHQGWLLGYPEEAFLPGRLLTRYEIASLLRRLADGLLEKRPALSQTDRATVQKLLAEFQPELAVIGADLVPLRAYLGQDSAPAAPRPPVLSKPVRLGGYLQLRYDTLVADSALFPSAGAGGAGQRPTQVGPHIGGASNGFLIRRARFRMDGPLNESDSYLFQLDFGTVSGVNLRDAYVDLKTGLPRHATFRIGQYPMPFSYVLLTSSRVREAPERPLGFSDSGFSNLIYKDTVSTLGGEVTPGTVVPLFVNQDRDIGASLTYQGTHTLSSFGWFNGLGRDPSGQRPLNSSLAFVGRVEHQLPGPQGTTFIGASHYGNKASVRGAAPTGTTPAPFVYADRRFSSVEARWEGKNGFQARYEHLWGTYEVTPDRARFLDNNKVESSYLTLRQALSARTAVSATYDVFRPTNQSVAGVSAYDYQRKTFQGGVLHQLSPNTRLRLWYVQGMSPYDPSAPAGSAARKRVGQLIGEIQVEY